MTALAVRHKVAASIQNQAPNAWLFLYREVLANDRPWLDELVRARHPQHLPVVLTREEVRAVRDAVRRDLRTVQELLGHRDVSTTLIYTHVLNRGPAGVRSPADGIALG